MNRRYLQDVLSQNSMIDIDTGRRPRSAGHDLLVHPHLVTDSDSDSAHVLSMGE